MIYQVVVDVANNNVDRLFDYEYDLDIPIGSHVLVPFGGRTVEGYILSETTKTDIDQSKIKKISRVLEDTPPIKEDLLKLLHFMCEYYHLRYIDVIRLLIPQAVRQDVGHMMEVTCTLNDDMSVVDEFVSKTRGSAKNILGAIQYLREFGASTKSDLSKKFSLATVNKLIKDKIIVTHSKVRYRVKYGAQEKDSIKLNDVQQSIVDEVTNSAPGVYLLHGVTGSGKTEVYMNIIKHALSTGKSAIMLVPEISLTPQVVRNFSKKFGEDIAVLHSGLSLGEKYDEWMRIYSGKARVVIGARSAIFAPVDNLGAIIIDEEHDGSYFSESNPRYYTHEVARFRAKESGCSLVLGSATPSIDSYHLAKIGQYKLLTMPERINKLPMPSIEIVDMAAEHRQGNDSIFSRIFLSELEGCIADGHQAMVYINRRGFASFLMCRECGYIPKCEDCDVSLVYHKEDNMLKCHYCGKRYRMLTGCPECGSHEIKLGGVGTERVCKELAEHFPNVPIYRMDNDTTRTKNAHAKILADFGSHSPSILVGTQMISKGHDFPNVTLVGILDADLSLFFNDFRATEKTYQLVTQVSGRAGRAKESGKVVLQTYFPKNYVYRYVANYDYEAFFDKEDNLRRITHFPPYSRLIRILVTSKDDTQAKDVAHDMFLKLKDLRRENPEEFYFLEAMRSPVARIKSVCRYQIVLRISDSLDIINKIYDIEKECRARDVVTFIELNAQNLK